MCVMILVHVSAATNMYVRATHVMYSGVDTKGNGNLVRRVLGLTTAFQKVCDLRSCDHAMTGNAYIRDFDGSQFR